MPKLASGRLNGIDGMHSFSSDELFALAARLEQQASDPENTDDPRWLKRWGTKIRKLANEKEAAVVSKARRQLTHRQRHQQS